MNKIATLLITVLCFSSVSICRRLRSIRDMTRNVPEYETPFTQAHRDNGKRTPNLSGKELRDIGVLVARDPTLGDATEGDMLNAPTETDRPKRYKRDEDYDVWKFLNRRLITYGDTGYNYSKMPFMKKSDYGGGYESTHNWYGTWANGRVPIRFSSKYPELLKDLIGKQIELLEKAVGSREDTGKKCIDFHNYNGIGDPNPKGNRQDYIYIRKPHETHSFKCASSVGRTFSGKQKLYLDDDCFEEGVGILHELMHALGLFHEQSRTDRDQYVEIVYKNILRGKEYQFNRTVSFYPYDIESVMHYLDDNFAKNGRPTIRIRNQTGSWKRNVKFHYRKDRLSEFDIQKIRYMYRCKPTYRLSVEGYPTDTWVGYG